MDLERYFELRTILQRWRMLLAYLFSLLTTLLPALQASRIYPAEALRYE